LDIIEQLEARLNCTIPTLDGVMGYTEDYTNSNYPVAAHLPSIEVGNDRFPLKKFVDPRNN